MCRLRNIAMPDYQESVTTRQTDIQTDAGQSDSYVPECFAGFHFFPIYQNGLKFMAQSFFMLSVAQGLGDKQIY